MSWVGYFKLSLFSKIWIALIIASAVLVIIRTVAQSSGSFIDNIPGILGGIAGGIGFAVFLDLVFSLLYATILTVSNTYHKRQCDDADVHHEK